MKFKERSGTTRMMNDSNSSVALESSRIVNWEMTNAEAAASKASCSSKSLRDVIGNNVMTWISAGTAQQQPVVLEGEPTSKDTIGFE